MDLGKTREKTWKKVQSDGEKTSRCRVLPIVEEEMIHYLHGGEEEEGHEGS